MMRQISAILKKEDGERSKDEKSLLKANAKLQSQIFSLEDANGKLQERASG